MKVFRLSFFLFLVGWLVGWFLVLVLFCFLLLRFKLRALYFCACYAGALLLDPGPQLKISFKIRMCKLGSQTRERMDDQE
jgi:hypothetical protein